MLGPSPHLALLLLLGGILPLAAGPFLAQWADRSRRTKSAFDAFIAVALGGIVILHLWPHAFLVAGGWAWVGGLAGLLLPFFLHGPLHAHERRVYPAMLAIAVLGLALHATLDGVALLTPLLTEPAAVEIPLAPAGEPVDGASADQHADDHDHGRAHDHAHGHGSGTDGGSAMLLALAVILHRLPMGLAVWWLTAPILGRRAAIGLLGVLAAATVVGFVIAGRVLVDLSLPGLAIFEATIAGMLLHVVMGHEHRHGAHGLHADSDQGHEHGHAHGHSHTHAHGHASVDEAPRASALGALVGLGFLFALTRVHPMEQGLAQELTSEQAFATLSVHLAPWILLGLVLDLLLSRRYRRWPAELSLPAFGASLALLGWHWTLVYAVGSAWVLGLGAVLAMRDPSTTGPDRSAPPPASTSTSTSTSTSSRSLFVRVERRVHRVGAWALVGLGATSLMEPILRIDPGTVLGPHWLHPGLELSLAALGGLFLGREPLFTLVLAFSWLHMAWPPMAVLAFLFAALLARGHRASPPRPKTGLALGALGLVLLLTTAPWLPQSALDFHALAEAPPSPLGLAAAVLFALAIVGSLFHRGFRGFLLPVFDTDADPNLEEPEPAEGTLADLFVEHVGLVDSGGDQRHSEDGGEKFTDALEAKRREGHL